MISELKTDKTEALPQTRVAGTLVALQLMLLLAAVEQTIISTAMPRIIDNLGGFNRYAWATTSYLLSSTIAIPIFGRLSDLFGRRLLLSSGVILFVASSVLCGLAGAITMPAGTMFDAMNQFVAFRLVQGLGGGVVIGLTFTVVGDLFSPAERGRYQGHFAAVFALASVVGPTLGGWVAEHLSWRWLFFSTVPIGIAALVFFFASFPDDRKKRVPDNTVEAGADSRSRRTPLSYGSEPSRSEAPHHTDTPSVVPHSVVPHSVDAGGSVDAGSINSRSQGSATALPAAEPIDRLGIALFALFMTFGLLALTAVCEHPQAVIGTAAGGQTPLLYTLGTLIAFATFLAVEARSTHPFMRLSYFRNSTINISCVSVFVTGMGMFGAVMMLPLFFQAVLGYSASVSGFLLTPLIICVALASIAGGAWLSSARRYRSIVVVGLTLMGAGTLLLSAESTRLSIAQALTAMLIAGTGLGIILPVYTVVIQNAVEQEEMGAVTGFSQFFRSVGGTTGVAASGALMLALYNTRLSHTATSEVAGQLTSISANPLDPVKMKMALAHLSGCNGLIVEQALSQSREALGLAMSHIFFCYALFLFAVLALNLFLAELPLRETTASSPGR